MSRSLKEKLSGNELDLSLNEIVEVPVKELSELPKATNLDLSCNKIEFLPPTFASLTFLVRLDLSKNKLKELPSNFGCLRLLHSLDLYSNELQVLPVSFCLLKNLKWLDLKNNPLEVQLKKAAGDCLDQKECQQCAIKVVAMMQEIQSNLEREKQKRLKEERAQTAARKAEEEKELQRQRQMKKAEKEERKAKAKNKKSTDNLVTEDPTRQQPLQNGKESSEGIISRKKPKSETFGKFIKLLLLLILTAPVVVFLAHLILNLSKGPIPSTMADAQVLLHKSVNDLHSQTTVLWSMLHSQSMIWKKNVMMYSKMAYFQWFPQNQNEKREL